MIRILHISDLHLESETPSLDKENIINCLATELKSFVNSDTILVFTGDLIDKGAFNFKDKENAFKTFENIFIDKILSENPSLKGKIFIVPGNHDVFRNKIDEITDAGLSKKLVDIDSLDSFIKENREKSKHLDRLEDYKHWEENFYKKYNNTESTNFDNSFKVEIDGFKIGISCFNSSWLCKDDNDEGSLLLGKSQIDNSLNALKDCDIKFALMHHPIEFFKDFDKENVYQSIYHNYNVLFTGHVHKLASSYTQDLVGNVFISIANSTIGDNPIESKYANGYTVVDYYPNDKIKTTYRKYLSNHQKFVPNTDIGSEDGTKEFNILKDEKILIFEKKLEVIRELENRNIDKINDDILISPNYTNAKCTIDNLFVEPRIINNPQDNLKEEDTIEYSLDSILLSNDNFIIYGKKESGKTLLVDKLFIECTRKFNQYDKIPVLLKFNELANKNISRIIREFLSISSKDLDQFLKENRILLLIDDIKFSHSVSDKIEKIKQFVTNYPHIQLIATSILTLESVLPTNYLAHNDVLKANIAFIQNFNSKEIKSLIQKWYNNNEIDLQDKMQKLIKSFIDFGLPRTPLSVTLFLWIFEKQEKKPINNAVLVEIFIENLLEKTKIENIYSETFDFANKKRLLSFVAKYMLDNGDSDSSYSVDYVDLLNFFKSYLETRFSGKPQKVLDDFIKRGIFSYQDENSLRFKSAFFFHFFLALQFDYEPSFKEYVFTGDNYLNFIEEITYYTGLKRDDVVILNFTQEKLNEALGDFNRDVTENFEKVDKVLESKKEQTITYQIDEKKVSKKMPEEQMDDMYDESLSAVPIKKDIQKKQSGNLETKKNIDKVLKLACSVLKNSEDVDDFEAKKTSYKNTLLSSISFLMQYRDALILYYLKYKKEPDHFPKNIDFSLFVRVLPLIHQVTIFNWLGTQKLRPVIIDKIEQDKLTLNISDYERFLSIFIYSDIRGKDYPIFIKDFVKANKHNYLKDLSFLKLLSYYHLRTNDPELNKMYLDLMAEIKQNLGHISKHKKSEFIQKLKENKKKGSL